MADPANNSPASSPQSKWLVRRLYPSTWFVLLLATSAMFLVEVPGQRTGMTTYAHGWPLAYLERDFQTDSEIASKASTYTDLTTYNRAAGDMDIDEARNHSRNGLPWEIEAQLSPWSRANAVHLSVWAGIVDAVVAVVLIGVIGSCFQRWRRRRRLALVRFRLRTMLIGVTILCILFARAAAWRDSLAADEELRTAVEQRSTRQNGSYEDAWLPPSWLPESLAKIGDLGHLFNRVYRVVNNDSMLTDETFPILARAENLRVVEIDSNSGAISPKQLELIGNLSNLERLDAQQLTDASVYALRQLKNLRSLKLSYSGDGGVTDAGMAEIAESFPKLTILHLASDHVTDEGLKRLIGLSELTDLDLIGAKITDAGIHELRALPHLKNLFLSRSDDEETKIDDWPSLNELTNLESLTLKECRLATIRLNGLPKLRTVLVTELFDRPGLKLVALQSLPNLEEAFIGTRKINGYDDPSDDFEKLRLSDLTVSCEARFHDLPKLQRLSLHAVVPSDAMTQDLANLPALNELDLSVYAPGNDQSLLIKGCAKLKSLRLRSRVERIELARMPCLQTVDMRTDDNCRSLSVAELPELECLVVRIVRPPEVTLHDLPSLNTLTIGDAAALDAEPSSAGEARFWGRLAVRGMSELGGLRDVTLCRWRFDPATLDDLGRMARLETLNLSASSLDDEGLQKLASLRGLSGLQLAWTQISDAGLETLRSLPNLKSVGLNCTALNDSAVQNLRQSRPDLDIAFDSRLSDQQSFQDQLKLVRADWFPSICPAGQIGDADLALLLQRPELRKLDLSAARHVTDRGMEHVGRLTRLSELDLSNTWITDAGLAQLAGLSELQSLKLCSTAVTGAGLKNLAGLSQLQTLDLSDAELTPEGLDALAALPHLKSLVLSGATITDKHLAHVRGLKRLETLELSAPQVSTTGLARLRDLPRLRSIKIDGLDVADGRLDLGPLGSLPQLRSLDLSKSAREAGHPTWIC